MKFTCLTLFPEMVLSGLNTSIIGKAVQKGYITINAVNIRDYTEDKHGKVDDYTYGGGAGMLMQAQPVFDAHKAVTGGRRVRTVYVTPQGKTFTQKDAISLSKEPELIFLCGHYEGIDERVLEEIVTDYYSIGDYVLTGGELPAMVMIDAVSRLVPGVLGNEVSADTESFHNDLLEYPQYSRPEVWHDKKVPDVLMSGNHSEIEKWRLEQSKERTKRIRPDLYKKYLQKEEIIACLSRKKRNNIHMIESLKRGNAEVLYFDDKNGLDCENLLLYNRSSRQCMIKAADPDMVDKMLAFIPSDTVSFITSDELINERLAANLGVSQDAFERYRIVCYTSREPLRVKHKDIRALNDETCEDTVRLFGIKRDGINSFYCAYSDGKPVGVIYDNDDGGMGCPSVVPDCAEEIAESLAAYLVNIHKATGYIPYVFIDADDDHAFKMYQEIGMYLSQREVFKIRLAF